MKTRLNDLSHPEPQPVLQDCHNPWLRDSGKTVAGQ
jgi:hypothetical protein